jgi:flagellar motor switch protein FliN
LSTSSSPNSSSSSDVESSPARVFQHLLDIHLPADVLLGTGTITIRQCLSIERNSLVELTQSAGEDLLLDVNGVQIARGEIVIVEDNAALRITEISEPPPAGAVSRT